MVLGWLLTGSAVGQASGSVRCQHAPVNKDGPSPTSRHTSSRISCSTSSHECSHTSGLTSGLDMPEASGREAGS